MAFAWQDVGEAGAKAAPVLGGVLGGPVGAAVGAAGSLLGSLFGVEGTPDAVMQALRKDPDALVKIKELEVQERANLLKWRTAQLEAGVDLERIAASDRDSARKREANTGDVWTPRILASVTMLIFMACVWCVFSEVLRGMDGAQIALIGGVVGYASAKADTVIAYYFGSSSGADDAAKRLYEGGVDRGEKRG